MGVTVKAKVLGFPRLSAEELELDLCVGTVSEAKRCVMGLYPDLAPLNGIALCFVNGRVVKDGQSRAGLSSGDSLIFVVPVSGG